MSQRRGATETESITGQFQVFLTGFKLVVIQALELFPFQEIDRLGRVNLQLGGLVGDNILPVLQVSPIVRPLQYLLEIG